MDRVLDAIDNGQPFSAIKLCHGFWEHWVGFERTRERLGWTHPLNESQWDEIISEHPVNWPADLFLEVRDYLAQANERTDVLTLVSPYGWVGGYEMEGTPYEGLEATEAVINAALPAQHARHDGLFWKNSVQDGRFTDFIETVRNRPTVLVGPAHVERFADFARLASCRFIEVDAQRAAWNRQADLERIGAAVEEQGESGVIVLLQAGGANSAWLVYELSRRYPGAFFLALGRVLDVANLEILRRINWYAVHHHSINKTLRAINPDWPAADADSPIAAGQGWANREANYEPGLAALLENEQASDEAAPATAMDFIENKPVDLELVQTLLERSRKENHWANFGPVSQLLERALARLLALPPEREVVVCKSATDAILGLVAAHELQAGKPMNWVVSAFGFFSTHLGALSGARILDCDEAGLIDAAALQSLDPASWDGVVITNPFATAMDLEPILSVADANEKRVIVDNAAALFTWARKRSPLPDEVISFHQTKPWGMGEGGCAVAQPEIAKRFRALVNFGVGLGDAGRARAMNSKLSDFDAALILQRLLNLPNWRRAYEMQRRRILSIALPMGFEVLGRNTGPLLQAHVPLLAPRPVPREALDNPYLTLRKYYQPLQAGHPVADDLFGRIVCVPCHPDVSRISTDDLRKMLSKFVG